MPHIPEQSSFESVQRLADLPIDDYAGYVASLDWTVLDGEWIGPVRRTWTSHVIPASGLSEAAPLEWSRWRSWVDAGGNRNVFAAVVADELRTACGRLAGMLEGGHLRLLGVLSSPDDVAEKVGAGCVSFPDATWTWDLSSASRHFTTAQFGRSVEGGADWFVLAEFNEADIHWPETLMMVVGFQDFEKQIVVRPDARAAAILSVTLRPGSTIKGS